MKIKRRNGQPCSDHMEQFNLCFDTLAWLDKTGSSQEGGPFNYERVYPYERGTTYQPMTQTLIVKNRQARFLFKSPYQENAGDPVNAIRQGNKFASTWTFDLPNTYNGGKIGILTFAHQAIFTNLRITDLSSKSKPSGYCNNEKDVYCDSKVSGLCVAVPLGDVCPYPVGAHMIDTSLLTSFEFVDDQFLDRPCNWEITSDNRLAQTTNANRQGTDPITLGCNALIRGQIYDDFIAQVEIEQHDK